MPRLALPDVRFQESFLVAVGEFIADGLSTGLLLGLEISELGDRWHDPHAFAEYVDMLHCERQVPRRKDWVPATTLWYVDEDDFLGRITVRHHLIPTLVDSGGHIGYEVRPSARRRGHATAMLRAVFPYCRSLGIERALVTVDVGNEPSRRVVEAVGGVFEDQRGCKARYWIRTTPTG